MKEKRTSDVALFIGAHPDDIEIGSGGTVCKLASSGWDVWLCVVTCEKNFSIARRRKKEARMAARSLGVDTQRVMFLDLPDTNLECNGKSVEIFREILKTKKLNPDVIFTHSKADSHNDHRSVHNLTIATFRKKPILTYGVVNSLIVSEFIPNMFINISEYYNQKTTALMNHQSQFTRVNHESIKRFNEVYSPILGFDKTEAFEVILQEGVEETNIIQKLNDCPFNKFWYTLIGSEKLFIIHGEQAYRKNKEWNWASDKDRAGMGLLHRAFVDMWYGRNPIEDYSCNITNIENLLQNTHVLLSGGAVSNSITRDYFNHFKGIRYSIDYSMPNYSGINIYDRVSNKRIYPKYKDDMFGNRTPIKDVGILTIMKNPLDANKLLIGCMGIHGFGSYCCYRVLSERSLLSKLTKLIEIPVKDIGYQILIEYDTQNERIKLLNKTLHKIHNS